MLFSHICLNKIVCFASWQVFYVDAGDNYHVDGGHLTFPYISLLSTIANQQYVMCTTRGEHGLISIRCQQKSEKQIKRIDGLLICYQR